MAMKHIMVTMLQYDTAYKEFMNILMFTMADRMNKAYKDHNKTNHLFYMSGNPFDTQYFILGQILQNDKGQPDPNGKPGGRVVPIKL